MKNARVEKSGRRAGDAPKVLQVHDFVRHVRFGCGVVVDKDAGHVVVAFGRDGRQLERVAVPKALGNGDLKKITQAQWKAGVEAGPFAGDEAWRTLVAFLQEMSTEVESVVVAMEEFCDANADRIVASDSPMRFSTSDGCSVRVRMTLTGDAMEVELLGPDGASRNLEHIVWM